MAKSEIQRFDRLLKKKTEKVAVGMYKTNSTRIAALAFPKGTKIYDQTNSKWVIGDGNDGGQDEDS